MVNPIQIQTYLKGVDYPAGKTDLLGRAEQEGADEEVRRALESLPDREFQSPAEVSESLAQGQ
ncbi:MAG: DUF2795 domain-containing protein [Thermomicrobiales bacterium]